jgi:predicted small secreted protein
MNFRSALPVRLSWLLIPSLVACSLSLSACDSLYSAGADAGAGIAGAAVAAKVTHSAAVATGIGLGAVAAANAGVQYSERVVHRYTQGRIATAAGPLAVGGIATWDTHHEFPIEPDEHGRVTVSRLISIGPLDCKEIVFSVDTGPADHPLTSDFYVATLCRDGPTWKWATAEPATDRWGSLQ